MTSSDLAIRGLRMEDGRTTTVKLEPDFWELLEHICFRERKSLNAIVREVDRIRGSSPRTSAIRVYILKYLRSAAGIGSEKLSTNQLRIRAHPHADVDLRSNGVGQ